VTGARREESSYGAEISETGGAGASVQLALILKRSYILGSFALIAGRVEALSPVVERPPPRRCYAQAGNLDLPLACLRGLAACRGKPLAEKIGQHINADPIGEQRRPGPALRTCVGEQLECAALVRVDFRSVQHLLEL
jgi:hypothetical protein